MPSSLQTSTYTLVTGASARSGSLIDPEKTTLNTVYYRFSGLVTGANVTFILEARDPNGNFGYIIDNCALTGTLSTSIATFNTPITNGVRANIQNIISGSGYVYLDSSY